MYGDRIDSEPWKHDESEKDGITMDIGTYGDHYTDLHVAKVDGVYKWGLKKENGRICWEEIPAWFYHALMKLRSDRDNESDDESDGPYSDDSESDVPAWYHHAKKKHQSDRDEKWDRDHDRGDGGYGTDDD